MKQTLLGAAALLALVACGPSQDDAQSPAAAESAALISGLALDNMDKSVAPGDDFFRYMNGAWIDRTEIPADKASYGGFGILNDETQEQVKAIIEESATGDFPTGSEQQMVGDLYKSYMDWDVRNAKGVEPLQPELELIAAISNRDELAIYFASALQSADLMHHWV